MTSEIRTIGVIGAGQMGAGIAHVAALAGFDVKLYDIAEDRVAAGMGRIDKSMGRQLASDKITEADRHRTAL